MDYSPHPFPSQPILTKHDRWVRCCVLFLHASAKINFLTYWISPAVDVEARVLRMLSESTGWYCDNQPTWFLVLPCNQFLLTFLNNIVCCVCAVGKVSVCMLACAIYKLTAWNSECYTSTVCTLFHLLSVCLPAKYSDR